MNRLVLIFAILLCAMPQPLRAEVFSWTDIQTGISLTFPDTWARAHNQKPDDRITVQAPGARDYASCRLRLRKDMRTMIFPKAYDRAVQHLYVTYDFWRDYVGEYSGAILHRVRADRGLVNTIAGAAEFTFISSAGPKALMRGFAFAGIEDGELHIFECSSEYESFHKWYPVFMSILKSGQKQLYTALQPYGDYRNFLPEQDFVVRGEHLIDFYR